jgi:hypothetical protein
MIAPKNLTPNPFPKWKGNRIKGSGSVAGRKRSQIDESG